MKTETIKKNLGVVFIGIVLACTVLAIGGVWGFIQGETAWQLFGTLVVVAIGLGAAGGLIDKFFKTAVLLLSIGILSPASYSQESSFDDDPKASPAAFVDPLQERVERLEAVVAENTGTLGDVSETLQSVAESMKLLANKAPMPQPAKACVCDCECPTLDEIRTVVREELDRVTVTLKTAAGTVKKTELPTSKVGATKSFALQPGDRVVAIDGVPVTPFTYQANERTVTQYATPRFDMRVTSQGNRIVGAVRQQTCRTVNGVRVCD
jgi:hypothetical protein